MAVPVVKNTDATEQLNLLAKISRPNGYDVVTMQPQDLADDAVRLWSILNIVRGGKSASGNSTIYNQALQSLGKNDEGTAPEVAAKQKLLQAFFDNLNALGPRVQTSADAGSNASALKTILGTMQSEMTTRNPYYADYADYRTRNLSNLMRALDKKLTLPPFGPSGLPPAPPVSISDSMSAPLASTLKSTPIVSAANASTTEEKEVVAPPGSRFVNPTEVTGNYHWVQLSGNLAVVGIGQTAPQNTWGLFKTTTVTAEQNANNFVTALDYANVANPLNPTAALAALKTALGVTTTTGQNGTTTVMAGNIASKQLLLDQNFQNALAILAGTLDKNYTDAQKLTAVMNYLQQGSLAGFLGTLLTVAQNRAVATVDSKAIVLYKGRATFTFIPDDSTSNDYQDWVMRSGKTKWTGGLVWALSQSFLYEDLAVTGALTSINVDPNTGNVATSTQKLTGSGNDVSTTTQVSAATSIGARPVQITAYFNVGYQTVALPTIDAPSAIAGVGQITPGEKGWQVNVYGLQGSILDRPDVSRFRYDLGVAGVGRQGGFAYATIYYTFSHSGERTVQLYVMPEYQRMVNSLGQWAVNLPAAEIGGKVDNAFTLFGRKVSLNASTRVDRNPTARSSDLSVTGGVNVALTNAIHASVNIGAIGTVNDRKNTASSNPLTPTVSGGLTWDATATSGGNAASKKLEMAPAWNTDVKAAYADANGYVAGGEFIADSTKNFADKLAQAIGKQLLGDPDLQSSIIKHNLRQQYDDAIGNIENAATGKSKHPERFLEKGLNQLKKAGFF